MNTSAKFLTLAFVTLSSLAFSAARPKEGSISLLESKHKNLFIFKVDKSMKGAMVLVYSATGDQIASQKLSTKKMTIDFSNVKVGVYTIQVKKHGIVRELNYEKKQGISEVSK